MVIVPYTVGFCEIMHINCLVLDDSKDSIMLVIIYSTKYVLSIYCHQTQVPLSLDVAISAGTFECISTRGLPEFQSFFQVRSNLSPYLSIMSLLQRIHIGGCHMPFKLWPWSQTQRGFCRNPNPIGLQMCCILYVVMKKKGSVSSNDLERVAY